MGFLLNQLTNSDIFPFFLDLVSKDSPESKSLEFIDLRKVQNFLNSPQVPPSEKSDEKLEQLLYGTTELPFYTGWTFKIIEELARAFSLGMEPIANDDRFQSAFQVRRIGDPAKKQLIRGLKRKRMGAQIWTFRKQLRAWVQTAHGRATALLHDPLKEQPGPVALNLGAGEENYPGFIKVDQNKFQHIYDNIITLEKIPASSIDIIYTNHVVEHIPSFLIPTMLKRWLDVLKPGGKLLLRAPDGRKSVENLEKPWKEASSKTLIALGFPNMLAKETKLSGVLDLTSCIQMIFGWSQSTPHTWDLSNQHKSLWTPALTESRLKEAGFQVGLCENMGTIQTVAVASR